MKAYRLKIYRRTKRGGRTGELLDELEFEAPGFAHAQAIVERDRLPKINFDYDFATLEGGDGGPFITLWLSEADMGS